MLNKKAQSILIIFTVFTIIFSIVYSKPTYAESSIDNKIQGSNPSTTTTTTTYETLPSYKKDVHVVGSRDSFQNYRFTNSDFSEWLKVYNLAKAVESFQDLISQKIIQIDGELLVSNLLIGKTLLNQGELVTLEQILLDLQEKNTTELLQSQLKAAQVLDDQGYLILPNNLPSSYDQIDFSFIIPQLDKISFQVNDPKLNEDLKRNLLDYLKNECRVVTVTQEETTRYQSANKDFFGNIFESIAGSMVASIFMPDRIQEVKRKVAWTSEINLKDYFTGLNYGFNQYPYSRNGYLLTINGKKSQNNLSFNFLERDNKYYSLEFCKVDIFNASSFLIQNAGFGGFDLRIDSFTQPNSSLDFYSLGLVGGAISNQTLFNFLAGLTYKTSSLGGYLGVNFGVNAKWYPIKPVALDCSYLIFAQPNFPAQKTDWEVSQVKLGLSAYLNQFEFKTGYHWVYSVNSELINNIFFQINYTF